MPHGDRVTLRGRTRDDLPLLWRFTNDLAVELAGGGDPPEPQAFERLLAQFEQASAKGGRDGAWFAIEVEGRFVGQCSLAQISETHRTARLGIGDRALWGQGYGREAIGLLLEYAFRYRNLERVWLWVHGRNERAIRAYRACGFVEEGRLRRHVWSDGAYDDAVSMGVLREEWAAARGRRDEETRGREAEERER